VTGKQQVRLDSPVFEEILQPQFPVQWWNAVGGQGRSNITLFFATGVVGDCKNMQIIHGGPVDPDLKTVYVYIVAVFTAYDMAAIFGDFTGEYGRDLVGVIEIEGKNL